jgi:hypothetical protein
MLRGANKLSRYAINAIDGEIGKVQELLHDSRTWEIRYLVVNTGHWLLGRRVLLAPAVLGDADDDNKTLSVSLTREQVENSPPVGEGEPLSRQQEIALQGYYGWPAYWDLAAGSAASSGLVLAAEPPQIPDDREQPPAGEPGLRSTNDLSGYGIQARDGEIGHLEDLAIDDEDWLIRYIVVDTRNWWPGKKVIVATEWVEEVRWIESKVVVDLSREAIRNSPEFDPSQPVNREYERKLYEHYGRTWTRSGRNHQRSDQHG